MQQYCNCPFLAKLSLFHICEREREVLKEKVKSTAAKKGTAYNQLWEAFKSSNKSTMGCKCMENV